MHSLRALAGYRDLLGLWIVREIRIRYKQSFLGAAWAVLQPLSLMLIFTLVFSYFVQVPSDGLPYPVFAYAGLLPWSFFATAVTLGVPSLVQNMNLVTKIYFPREVLPVASVCAGLMDLALGFVVFGALLLVYRIPPALTWLWLPVLLVVQLLLALGVTLLGAAANVFYRDVRFVVPLALQLWLYATPVIYPLSAVPAWLRPVYALNPMVGIVDGYRRVLLEGEGPSALYLGTAFLVSLALAAAAYAYFKRVEWKFADLI